MLINKIDIEKALNAYKQKVNRNLFFRFASTPPEIVALRCLVAQSAPTNEIEKQNNPEFSKEEFLQLIHLLLEIEWHSHLTGYFDDMYRCLNSYKLLVKAVGNDKAAYLKEVYTPGSVEDENIAKIVSSNFVRSATPGKSHDETGQLKMM